MHVLHFFPEHSWHLSGQATHFELTRERPGAQEVHSVMLVVVQFEQEAMQPTQVSLMMMNPCLQRRHFPVASQVTQFAAQGEHVLFTNSWLGGHSTQKLEVPSQRRHFRSHGTQLELALR